MKVEKGETCVLRACDINPTTKARWGLSDDDVGRQYEWLTNFQPRFEPRFAFICRRAIERAKQEN